MCGRARGSGNPAYGEAPGCVGVCVPLSKICVGGRGLLWSWTRGTSVVVGRAVVGVAGCLGALEGARGWRSLWTVPVHNAQCGTGVSVLSPVPNLVRLYYPDSQGGRVRRAHQPHAPQRRCLSGVVVLVVFVCVGPWGDTGREWEPLDKRTATASFSGTGCVGGLDS